MQFNYFSFQCIAVSARRVKCDKTDKSHGGSFRAAQIISRGVYDVAREREAGGRLLLGRSTSKRFPLGDRNRGRVTIELADRQMLHGNDTVSFIGIVRSQDQFAQSDTPATGR